MNIKKKIEIKKKKLFTLYYVSERTNIISGSGPAKEIGPGKFFGCSALLFHFIIAYIYIYMCLRNMETALRTTPALVANSLITIAFDKSGDNYLHVQMLR